MEFCIFHGNSFQNGFPEFAHILQVEFLTVQEREKTSLSCAQVKCMLKYLGDLRRSWVLTCAQVSLSCA